MTGFHSNISLVRLIPLCSLHRVWHHYLEDFFFHLLKMIFIFTRTFDTISKLRLLDDISHFDNDWLPFKYFLRQLDSTLLLASCMTLLLRRLFLPHIKDDSQIEDDITYKHFLKWFSNYYFGMTTFHISIMTSFHSNISFVSFNSTLLLASCMTLLFRRLLPLIEDDFCFLLILFINTHFQNDFQIMSEGWRHFTFR